MPEVIERDVFFSVRDDENGNPIIAEVKWFNKGRTDMRIWSCGIADAVPSTIEVSCYVIFPEKEVSHDTFWRPNYIIHAHGDNQGGMTDYAVMLYDKIKAYITHRGYLSA